MEFARLSITGMPVSKRKIKPFIDKGLVKGYDDIRLPTLRGLKKRGILPEAIRDFVFSQGISKSESNVDFSLLESANKKILDPIAKRYFFVNNPIKLNVVNAEKIEKKIDFHPTAKLGNRTIKANDIFYIPGLDVKDLKNGDIFRLKDLYNVKIVKKDKKKITGEYFGKDLIKDTKKIQWTTDKFVEMNVFIPYLLFKNDKFNPDSLEKIKGYAEESVSKIKTGEIVQFERFGFVRIENIKNEITGFFTHK
jgi:glutamyl-tRNA synthetase